MSIAAAQDHRYLAKPGCHPVLQKRQVHYLQSHSEPIHGQADREQLNQVGLVPADHQREHEVDGHV